MRQDDRVRFDQALERARRSAHAPGEFVGQESFMGASEILALAEQAGIDTETSVLDLCCGVAGPGRLIAATWGCTYLGVDSSPGAVSLARQRSEGLGCRFQVAQIPPLPGGTYDVVLLLETMLAFRDKATLLREVAAALPVGGRFAFTVEEGQPLTDAEREAMPDADTVWLVTRADLLTLLERVGLGVRWMEEVTDEHCAAAEALTAAYDLDRDAIASLVGDRATDDLLRAHRLWSDWLSCGRVRKFAIVAESGRSGVGA